MRENVVGLAASKIEVTNQSPGTWQSESQTALAPKEPYLGSLPSTFLLCKSSIRMTSTYTLVKTIYWDRYTSSV